MGSENFPQLLFDKVYKDDITRLRSMEEMWKTRRRPEPLDYATILAKFKEGDLPSKGKILRADQRAWTLEENVIIFQDRHVYFNLSTLVALMLFIALCDLANGYKRCKQHQMGQVLPL